MAITFAVLVLRLSLFASALADTHAIYEKFVLHEKRQEHWADTSLAKRRIDEDAILPMRIGLMQNEHAQANAERWLMDVSHPNSKNYGRHWTQAEVVSAFQPSIETIQNVTAWLYHHQIYDFTHSDNKLWFAFDIPASKAEQMLQTEYFEYMNEEGELETSCDYYHLPESIQPHVHYLKPGILGKTITGRIIRRRSATRQKSKRLSARSEPTDASSPSDTNPTSLEHCWKAVTPACVRAMYNISAPDPKLPVSSNNSLGLFEYDFQDIYYQPSLNDFYRNFAPEIPQGTSPIFSPIAGTFYPENKKNYTHNANSSYDMIDGYEIELDSAVALPIIYPQNVTAFTVETGYPIDALDIWLDALDGSYCSEKQEPFTGNGTLQCGIYTPPAVLALPYDYGEYGVSHANLERQCNEYLKLGLQGHSIFFASGDNSVGGWPIGPTGCKGEGPRVFAPNFPASCPWITSVGATMIPEGGTVDDAEVGAEWYGTEQGHNGVEKTVFESAGSGGFSITFSAPSYQKNALATYFKDHNPPWPYFVNGSYLNNTGRYNRNGRGFPDLAAVGTNVVDYDYTKYNLENGTSCAAPLVGAMFNRIVEERIRAGKKGPLGFVNPVLYQHPEIFKDVVKGENGLCAPDQGFQAVPGWDPVTGLGVPMFPKLMEVFLSLS